MLELRRLAQVETSGRTLSGYAAVFNRPSRPLLDNRGRPFVEFVNRGAFAESLSRGGIWALWNHDGGEVLGKFPETLSLSEDSIGLRFSMELPATSRGNDVVELISRGILDGQMSFGFRAEKDRWEDRDGERIRNLDKVDLREISIVPEAAYPDTHSQLRGVRGLDHYQRRLALAVRTQR
jgi:HK97 family phage prohead protease